MSQIKPQPNEFADELLDHVGQEFRWDHPKGLAEWLKNSADAYQRAGVPEDQQVVLIELHERNPKRNSEFKVLDFVGMTHDDIDKAFKRWGDPKAAGRGTSARTFGGHGNGGKFYMRQGFETSEFITYKNGLLNVFGFNKDKRYGFDDEHEELHIDLTEALSLANIEIDELPEEARKRLGESGGFTVVIGHKPEGFSGRSTSKGHIEKLLTHPQARRVIARRPVFCRVGKSLGVYARLLISEPEAREGFEAAYVINMPMTLTDENGDEHVFRDDEYPDGWLELRVSKEPLRRSGGDRIDISGELSSIGSYATHELGGAVPTTAEFIWGECSCPKLEDPNEGLVMNDREKLADSPKARVLLDWIREEVTKLASQIEENERQQRQEQDLTQSSVFNEFLNQWKNKFMTSLMATLFGGPGEGGGFGGSGDGSGGSGDNEPSPDGDSNDTDSPSGSGDDGGGGEDEKKGPRAPQVLLSSHDSDPLNPLGGPVVCDPEHPAVYQRYEDVDEGIFWINTSRPLAQRIFTEYGSQSTRWRDYMFQRYQEIILKASIYELERKVGNLSADRLDAHIDEVYKKLHDGADAELASFLFDEKLSA